MAEILFNTAFMWTSISNRLTLPAKNAELELGGPRGPILECRAVTIGR